MLTKGSKFWDIFEVMAYVERALGEYASSYDVEAIARNVVSWYDRGQFFVMKDEYTDEDTWWELVSRYEVKTC